MAFSFYEYTPSLAAAAIFTIIFLLLSLLHSYQLFRTRTWFFISFTIGGFLETIGYIGRAMSAHQAPDYTLYPYLLQSVFILIAPALFAASIYMMLGRIILVTEGERHSLISRGKLTKIFVLGDVLSFFMQGGGGGLTAGASRSGSTSMANMGKWLIIGGLVVQIAFFSMFIVTSSVFHMRMSKRPTNRVLGTNDIPWKKHMSVLYIASFFILIRSLYRVAEYGMGTDSYLMTTEWPLYILDALLMSVVMMVFAWQHPSEIGALLQQKGRGMAMEDMERIHSLA